jgi:hypothetical protein
MNQQNIPTKEWPALRVIHINGGSRAINDCNNIVNICPLQNGKKIQFCITEYSSIYKELTEKGISILGIEFYSNYYEYNDISPPQWRVNYKHNNIFDTIQKWARLTHAGIKKQDGRFIDITSRIRYQLDCCDWRLKEISDYYNKQLLSILADDKFEDCKKFENRYSQLSYLSIQSFLIDACILRDFLAEISYLYCYDGVYSNENITTMNSLRKIILKAGKSNDELTKYIIENANKEDGWLTKLGTYRDVITHGAPIQLAYDRLFSVCKTVKLSNSEEIPSVSCPLPINIKEIERKRSKIFYKNYDELQNIFTSDKEDAIDGMEYCYGILCNLTFLSNIIIEKLPYIPEEIIIKIK